MSYAIMPFDIYINDYLIGCIYNKGVEQYEVTASLLSIQIKIDFCRSKVLQVNLLPGHILYLRCGVKGLGLNFNVNDYLYLELEPWSFESPDSWKTQEKPSNTSLEVTLEPEIERIRVITEDIQVPLGVIIRVTRSRTLEHTLELNWSDKVERQIEASLKGLIGASIRKQIESQQGQGYKESETVSYEIELNGLTSTKYKLVWTDIWQQGTVKIPGEKYGDIPFRFRGRTELEVLPLEHEAG